MTQQGPRVAPLPEAKWSHEVRELLGKASIGETVYNIFSTLARHPALLERWLPFGNHVLFKNTLPARERELVILRIGWLCKAPYEWGQHVVIGKRAGLKEQDFVRIAKGPEHEDLSELDRLLLRATDELHEHAKIGDSTWAALEGHLNTQQLMDLVFTVGQYNMVSMALNTFGVELDEGVPTFDQTPGFHP